MFRIDSQPAPQPAKAVGGPAAPAAPAPNSLEGLMKSLEEAIQRLMQQQGGAHAGGGDRMEPAPRAPTHRHHHHHHRPAHQPAPTKPGTGTNTDPVRTAPTLPTNTGPVISPKGGQEPTDPNQGPVVVKLPNGGELPAQAQGAQSGGIISKGLAGGTVGT